MGNLRCEISSAVLVPRPSPRAAALVTAYLAQNVLAAKASPGGINFLQNRYCSKFGESTHRGNGVDKHRQRLNSSAWSAHRGGLCVIRAIRKFSLPTQYLVRHIRRFGAFLALKCCSKLRIVCAFHRWVKSSVLKYVPLPPDAAPSGGRLHFSFGGHRVRNDEEWIHS